MDYLTKYVPNAVTATVKVVCDKCKDYTDNESFNANPKRIFCDSGIKY